MATVEKWTPFGVALDVTANATAVKRTSATQYEVTLAVSWKTYYSGAKTNYGMTAESGGVTARINAFGNYASSGSGTFTGVYSISGNAGGSKNIPVTFRNFNTDKGHSAAKTMTLTVSVPAWTSYTVSYNANGGTGAPSSQTKWKDQTLKLSSTTPTRTGYSFQGWAIATILGVEYAPGANYTANASVTLYAVWKPNTYTVSYNANGGTGAPGNQTKEYGTTLKLSSTKPTRDKYTFLGWAKTASATTATYASGANYTDNAAVTLYAVWQLAYSNPAIFNFTANRCDGFGNISDDGYSFFVSLDWKSTYADPFLNFSYTPCGYDYNPIPEFNLSGTSGHFEQVLDVWDINPETSYTLTASLSDEGGETTTSITINSTKQAIDCKAGNEGVAFGKCADLGIDESLGGKGVADFAFDAKFNEPVYGKALGMDKLPAIPSGSDFNNYMETGCYAVQSNAVAATCANIPVDRAGRLEVWSATGEGVRLEQWSYLRQRYIPYNSGNAVWERELTRGEDNVWNYYDWWKSSLTPAASEKVYSKAAMTIALGANTTSSTTGAYTQVPLNITALSTSGRLTLENGAIRVGANISHIKVSGQVLLKCGSTTGNRHARIQKVSGTTTTSIGWSCVYGVATSNTVYPMTPIIVSVKEGDLLKMVYYTSDASDYIASGSSANGWQTYLTVEEL